MKAVRSLVALVSAAFGILSASAAWIHDSENKTLSDGNWTFTVDEVTIGEVSGLRICSATVGYDGGDTVVDLTSCLTDPACAKPVIAINVQLNAMPATKFIAPHVLMLTDKATFSSNKTLEEVYLPKCTSTSGKVFSGASNLAKVTIGGFGTSAVAGLFSEVNSNHDYEFDLYWTGEEIPASFAYGCFQYHNQNLFRLHCRGKALNNWLDMFARTCGEKSYSFCRAEDFTSWGYKTRLNGKTIPDNCRAVVWEWYWSYFWICAWEYDEPTVLMNVAVPDHVAVKEVRCNGEYVNLRAGGYKVPADEKVDITYVVLDGMTFEDGSTEYTVKGVTPAAEIPASTCDKAVVEAVPRTLSVDLAELNASGIMAVSLACDVEFTCATNGDDVVWTVAGGVPFTLTYTSVEGKYFGESRTMSVAYASGIAVDTTVDVDSLPKPTAAPDIWKEVVEGDQHYLQNLGLGWKLYVSAAKKTINGVTGFEIFRTAESSVTAVALARADGVLDLTGVEADTGSPVVAVGSYAFNDDRPSGVKNPFQLTKFIAPDCQSIGSTAFRRSARLGVVRISPTASAVFSESAFVGCTSLTNFTPTVLPNVTTIGVSAFSGAPVGGDWVLAGVTQSERTFFQNCTNPAGFSVSLPNLVKFTGGNAAQAFANSTITNFSAPKLADIGSGQLFSACKRLTDVYLPDFISTISANTFIGCSSLTNLHPMVFTNLTTLGGSAFSGCSSLEGELVFPLIGSLPGAGFEGMTRLSSIVAPNAIIGGQYVFNDCSSLTNLVIGGIDGTRSYCFNNCSLLENIWVTGAFPAPGTDRAASVFSQGWNGKAETRPVVWHVKKAESEVDYSGWEALCNQTKADIRTNANTRLIANYADKSFSHLRLIGYVGGEVALKKDGTIDHYYPAKGDLCWFVKWEDSGLSVIVK